jgi:hypothetical protein
MSSPRNLLDRSPGAHFRERASATIAGPSERCELFPALLLELGQSFVDAISSGLPWLALFFHLEDDGLDVLPLSPQIH